MITGHVRDNFPRVTLAMPGRDSTINVEFVVDTGFEGELALPDGLIRDLEASYAGSRPVMLADGTTRFRPVYRITIDWIDDPREADIYVLDGNPLLGVELLNGNTVQMDMADGGEVTIDPL